MKRVFLIAAVAVSAPFATAVQAGGDVEAGKQKSQPCAACHGDGNKSIDPQYPRLSGQYADYLVKALTDYKTGARKNPIMAGFAQALSAEDIEDLAAFYQSQPGELEDLSHME